MKRRPPPGDLTEGFLAAAIERHGRLDWLKRYDPRADEPTHGRLEGTHLISKMRCAKILGGQLLGATYEEDGTPVDRADIDDLVELCRWDPRNAGGLAYTSRHGRFDGFTIKVPAPALPAEFFDFVADWGPGFELEAMRHFPGAEKILAAREPVIA